MRFELFLQAGYTIYLSEHYQFWRFSSLTKTKNMLKYLGVSRIIEDFVEICENQGRNSRVSRDFLSEGFPLISKILGFQKNVKKSK